MATSQPRSEEDIRETLRAHTNAIAKLDADMGELHRDYSEMSGRLDDIHNSLQLLVAKNEATPQKPGIATILTAAVSICVIVGFLFGGLRWIINSEVESSKILLEHRVAQLERAVEWTPKLVSVTGWPSGVGR